VSSADRIGCPVQIGFAVQVTPDFALERIMKEIRRRTRVVGAFPDGNSALMLCAARLRHLAGTKWGQRCYLNMALLKDQLMEEAMEAIA